jgi:beta-barrel assembly-enhancing protease
MQRGMVALLVAFTTVLVAQGPREIKPGFNLFSKEQDVQLGKEAAAQIEQQVQVVNNRELTDYINRLGQRLASFPEADKYPYTFKVVNDPSINAFALPGGPIYVHTGTIRQADNEGQLVGVMAHEIAHVALRHGTNQVSRANLVQIPAMLAGAMVGNGSLLGQLAQLGVGVGANGLLLKYSRDAERQSDILGARMMAQAGYNPIEMARFFEKMQGSGGGRGVEWFSSHPDPGNRVKNVQQEIQYMGQSNYNAGTGQLARMQQIIDGLPKAQQPRGSAAGTDAVQAPAQAPAASRRLVRYDGRGYTLSYPDNWKAYPAKGQTGVTIAPPEGLAPSPGGGTAIAYGVVADTFASRSGSLEQSTEELIRSLQQSNPSMRRERSGSRRTQVGGQNALVTNLASDSPFAGRKELNVLVTVARPGGVFYVLFVAPENHYNQLNRTFEQMLSSVRF